MENQEEQKQTLPETQVSAGSDVEMIEVNTPNFFGRHFLHLLAIFGIGFLSFFFVFNVYYVPITIVGSSMQPTINTSITYANDTKHCDVVYYRAKDNYDIGDILIVNAVPYLPSEQDSSSPVTSVIKRLVAKPGQTVGFKIINAVYSPSSGRMTLTYSLLVDDEPEKLAEQLGLQTTCTMSFPVVVNGLTFDYANVREYSDFTLTKAIWESVKNVWASLSETNPVTYSITIGDGELFACGDNRNNSTDCRWFGPIKQADVMGNVRIHVPYGSNMFVAIWNALFKK
ncbi:MAG: signal peptidase I [Clostridia bacterium]|nr:signal peptidase I [Clostridia bacterium]